MTSKQSAEPVSNTNMEQVFTFLSLWQWRMVVMRYRGSTCPGTSDEVSLAAEYAMMAQGCYSYIQLSG